MILASQVWTQVFWTSVIAGGLLAGVPLMFTALGETISERAGVLNIGLEGMMLLGAYVGFLGAYYGDSVWVGFLAGIARRHARLAVHGRPLRAGSGSTRSSSGSRSRSPARGSRACSSRRRVRLDLAAARRRADRSRSRCSTGIPVVGRNDERSSASRSIVYLGFALRRWCSRGSSARRTSASTCARRARSRRRSTPPGVSVVATRSYAALATGALAGLGGAYLAIVGAGRLPPFITQGQGYMAIVIAMLAPRPAALGRRSARCCSASRCRCRRLAAARRDQHLDRRRPHAARSRRSSSRSSCSPAAAYLPPALALPYVRGAR